jgi:CheY-like chemotaxis protein
MADQDSMLNGRRILVADDEAFSLSIIVRLMRELGNNDVLPTDNGDEALKQLKHCGTTLSLAILDFNMPEANGLQVLKQVRTGEAGVPRDLNVLMLTGSSDFGLVGTAMALDVDAFVIKPVSKQALASRLEKVFVESRDIKPAAVYEKIDIDVVSKRLLSNKPVGTPRPKSELKKSGPSGMKVRLESVIPGSILAENVRSPTGELLLAKATVLTERLLRRLKELQHAISLEYLYILPSEPPAAG